MVEKFEAFVIKKKGIKDKKKKLSDLGKKDLEIQKKMNTWVNGASSF